jgi:hypothetical protein
MALKDKKSKFDRHYLGEEGNNVGNVLPMDGPFFTDSGKSNSPFKTHDHMVELLNNSVNTTTGNIYKAVPHNADFQDLPIDMVNSGPAKYEDNLPS